MLDVLCRATNSARPSPPRSPPPPPLPRPPTDRPVLTAFYFLLFLAEWPLMTLRYLSIPAADCGWDAPRRALLLLTPPFALLLLLLEASGGEADAALHQLVPGLGVRAWLVLAGAGAVLSVLLMWGTHAKAPPGCHPMLVICGFVVAVVWLDLLAGEVRVPPPHMLEEKPQRTRVRSLPEWV